ncbi:hypothetical protein AJ80_04498 [Polytolypa hystricis UAMH7299]|uniref:PLD phosphodiesterase domain-containing protein n=1 Tax=Polytolypa hystricis (strain UAMH7299) TaxID=1447883 RepID=A0A2B7YAV7_POLH7|nr:hypothetical protein AJ80_04498 [Polytolypa hystricis UAMH7299]
MDQAVLIILGYIVLPGLLILNLLRQPQSKNQGSSKMVSQEVYELCHSETSVISELAKNPSLSPRYIIKRLYKRRKRLCRESAKADKPVNTPVDIRQAYECGKWGSQRPSDLFLQIYHDVLCTLEKDSMSNTMSPSLIGSSGVVPLTIIAPLPDICRHMANCIVRAKKEIFLATNYWVFSDASTLITNAMKELSARAGKRGEKVVMKLIYDRASPKQVFQSRLLVYPDASRNPRVRLPAPEEIPNIDLQVMNYHERWLGTFHSKFMIVDRRLALLQSSNIQDNDNLEMMIRVEGPIVDSFYDMALVTWNTLLEPPLPMINSPAASKAPPSFAESRSLGAESKRDSMEPSSSDESLAEHEQENPHYDDDIVSETGSTNAVLRPHGSESKVDAVTRHLNIVPRPDIKGDAPEWDDEAHMTPYILHEPHEPVPMALVCRPPWGALNHTSVHTPQNAAFLSAIRNAQHSILIQTPNLNAKPLLDPILDAVRRGVVVTCYLCLGYNDAGQLLPFQNGTNEMVSHRLYSALESEEEKKRLKIYNYVGKDQTRPIHKKFNMRSCHIKLMIIDEHIAIQGNANLDAQSIFHSQETNILLDSPAICKTWLDGIQRNQNTAAYGAVSTRDGCWHDPLTGQMAQGSLGIDPGRFSWIKGFVGAVERVRGVGGF